MKKTVIELCEKNFIHKEVLEQVKPQMLDSDVLFHLSSFFKVFSDETRLRIVNALSIAELCVCDISNLLQMTQSSISHQLKTLRELNLVKTRKIGKVVYYSLQDDHILEIFKLGYEHIMEVNDEKSND